MRAKDIEIGSFLASYNLSKELVGINLLLKRVSQIYLDLDSLICKYNKWKTFSVLVGVPKSDPLGYLKKIIILKKG